MRKNLPQKALAKLLFTHIKALPEKTKGPCQRENSKNNYKIKNLAKAP